MRIVFTPSNPAEAARIADLVEHGAWRWRLTSDEEGRVIWGDIDIEKDESPVRSEGEIRRRVTELELRQPKLKRTYQIAAVGAALNTLRWVLGEDDEEDEL